MRKTPVLLWLLLLLFVGLLFFIPITSSLGRRAMKIKTGKEYLNDRTRELLEVMQKNCSTKAQYRRIILDFFEKAGQITSYLKYEYNPDWETRIRGIYDTLLHSKLPPHVLVCAYDMWKQTARSLKNLVRLATDPFGLGIRCVKDDSRAWSLRSKQQIQKLFWSSKLSELGLIQGENVDEILPELSKKLIRFYKEELKVNSEEFSEFEAMWRRMTGLPLIYSMENGKPMQIMEAAPLEIYETTSGRKGFFLAKRNRTDFMLVIMDMNDVAEEIGMRMTLEYLEELGTTVNGGFISNDHTRTILPDFADKFEEIVELVKANPDAEEIIPVRNLGFEKIIVRQVAAGIPWKAFLAVPKFKTDLLPIVSFSLSESLLLLLALVIVAFTLNLLRSRFSVGVILLLAFFSIALMPLGGIHSILAESLGEYSDKLRQDLTQEMLQDLHKLDRNSFKLHAELIQGCRREGSRGEFIKNVTKYKKSDESTRKLLEQMMINCGRSTIAGDGGIDLLSLATQYGFAQTSHKYAKPEFEKSFTMAFHDPLLDSLEKFCPEYKRDRSLRSKEEEKAAINVGLKGEAFGQTMMEAFGKDSIFCLLSFPNRLNRFVFSNLITLFFIITPIGENPLRPVGLAFWMWSDWSEEKLLRNFVRNIEESFPKLSQRRQESFILRLLNRLTERKKVEAETRFWYFTQIVQNRDWQVMGKLASNPKSLPEAVNSGIISKSMKDTIAKARESGIPSVSYDRYFTGKPISVAACGRNLTRYVLAKYQTTDWMDYKVASMRNIIGIFSLLAVLGAFIVARLGQGFIVVPLNFLHNAISSIREGNLSVRLDEERDDEFGTLARSFNKMVQALAEGKILKSYLSESALKAAYDNEFKEKATKGELREVTILFSAIAGFSQMRKAMDPEELFQNMSIHLKLFSDATASFGGEIDKVMEDKILLIFDHDKCGGQENAVEIAIKVMNKVFSELNSGALHIAMGINSGPVLAGILGAESVRKDYTVIGDTVNLASRLACLAQTLEEPRVIISGETLKQCRIQMNVKKLPFLKIKGKKHDVEAYSLVTFPDRFSDDFRKAV